MASVWGFGTVSDPWLAAALWSALAATAATLGLIAAILVARTGARRRQARRDRTLARWRPVFAAAIAGEDLTPPRVRTSELRDVLALWNQYAVAVKGSGLERLRALQDPAGLRAATHGLLRRRSLRDRLLALATLGHLAEREAFDAVAALAGEDDATLSLAAARTLIAIDAAAAWDRLEPRLARRTDWPVERLVASFAAARSDDLPRLVRRTLENADTGCLPRLLGLARAVPPQALEAPVRRILGAPADAETLAAALRLLASPRDIGLARALVGHETWFVRLAAVRALGRFGTREDLPRLAAALADPVWWVRQRAADTLVGLPWLTPVQQRQLRDIVTDPYGAAALDRAIAERGGP